MMTPHPPADYHPPEQGPEDQGWGWVVLALSLVVTVIAGVVFGPVGALSFAVGALLGLFFRAWWVRHRRAA